MKRIHPLATVHPTDVADRNALATALGQYRELWQPRASPDGADGDRSHTALVSRFYDVVTPFYEYAWGTSFHFSPRHPASASPKRNAVTRRVWDVFWVCDPA